MRPRLLFALLLSACAEAQLGDPCSKHRDCAAVPGAYCARVRVCTKACSAEDLCPAGTICGAAATSTRAVCLRRCEDGCEEGESCRAGACSITDPLAPR